VKIQFYYDIESAFVIIPIVNVYCSAQEFCSVGDDSCLIFWDARVGTSPVVKVIFFFSSLVEKN
jgi:hypothetical protein